MYLLELLKLIPLTLLGFLATLLATGTVGYYTQPGGELTSGGIIESKGTSYQPIDIINYNNVAIKNLEILMRGKIEEKDISKSVPLDIKLSLVSKGGVDYSMMTIDTVFERSSSRLLIEIPDKKNHEIYFPNMRELQFTSHTDSIREPKWIRAINDSFVSLAILFLGITVLFPFFFIHTKEMVKKTDDRWEAMNKKLMAAEEGLKKSSEEGNVRARKAETEAKRSQGYLLKMRLYLMKKNHAYQVELIFFKRVFSLICLKSGISDKKLEVMITKELKTYQTRDLKNVTEEDLLYLESHYDISSIEKDLEKLKADKDEG